MNRHDMIFDITYSYHVEDMIGTFTGRLDKLISILLFILGGTVFTPYSNVFIFGIFVSCLSAIQFFYQFSKKSSNAELHAKKYLSLIHNADRISEDTLHKELDEIQQYDTKPFKFIQKSAFKRTCITLNLKDKTDKLTFLESILSWYAGDLPR